MSEATARSTEAARVLFVSHCDFTGNSAYHVLAICRELERLGFSPAIAVPDNPGSVDSVGRPAFPVISYRTAAAAAATIFPDNGAPDFIHAFTPREHVRRLTETVCDATGVPYFVHLEDNEEAITRDDVGPEKFAALSQLPFALGDSLIQPWRSHPVRAARFLAGAMGVTAVIDRLLERKPPHVPGTWFWPGFDDGALEPGDGNSARLRFGVAPEEIVLAYTGNIHASNVGEVQSLYIAVGLLRRAGHRVRLLKTGWNHVDMTWVADCGLGEGLLDLGFVDREQLWSILGAADILVQPGTSNEFNDFRFPSKLPDFLVSGKPVVLPSANIGRYLTDGKDALLLQKGDATEIYAKVERLAADSELRTAIGRAGREFALAQLTWRANIRRVVDLYESALTDATVVARPAQAPDTAGLSTLDPPVKLIAFYLPQFHPIPENDEWWGEGFTEWTNVKRARPQFEGHYQPQLPTELGFYDLRDPEILCTQARLARSSGIYGFCFYYYWFNGRRVLERPLNQMLESGNPRLPFCYCWANENWTRRWDGQDRDVLLRQEFGPGWAERFIRELLPALADERYVRVRNAPLLLVYRANLVPDIDRAADTWREIADKELGLHLHLAAVQSFGIGDPRTYGLDAAVEFPPHTERFLLEHSEIPGVEPSFRGYFEDYEAVMSHQLGRILPEYPWYRGAMPAWDNTARRGRDAHILVNSSPDCYGTWLRKLGLQAMCRSSVDEPLVFINAWNEWAEGTHLEPDDRYGFAWLEATRDALRDCTRSFYATQDFDLAPEDAIRYLQDALPVP